MTEHKRTCGDCTACCQGWLEGTAHGIDFYNGVPCHFVGCNGCTIYENRPQSPCKDFSCQWLINNDIPEWMKPNKSNVIVSGMKYSHPNGSEGMYLEVTEMGKTIDAKILNWFFKLHVNKQVQIKIQVEGGWSWFGTKEFLEVTGCTNKTEQ